MRLKSKIVHCLNISWLKTLTKLKCYERCLHHINYDKNHLKTDWNFDASLKLLHDPEARNFIKQTITILKFNKLPMSGIINKQHLNKHTFSHKYNNHHNTQGVNSMCINISHIYNTVYVNMCSNIYQVICLWRLKSTQLYM